MLGFTVYKELQNQTLHAIESLRHTCTSHQCVVGKDKAHYLQILLTDLDQINLVQCHVGILQ